MPPYILVISNDALILCGKLIALIVRYQNLGVMLVGIMPNLVDIIGNHYEKDINTCIFRDSVGR